MSWSTAISVYEYGVVYEADLEQFKKISILL